VTLVETIKKREAAVHDEYARGLAALGAALGAAEEREAALRVTLKSRKALADELSTQLAEAEALVATVRARAHDAAERALAEAAELEIAARARAEAAHRVARAQDDGPPKVPRHELCDATMEFLRMPADAGAAVTIGDVLAEGAAALAAADDDDDDTDDADEEAPPAPAAKRSRVVHDAVVYDAVVHDAAFQWPLKAPCLAQLELFPDYRRPVGHHAHIPGLTFPLARVRDFVRAQKKWHVAIQDRRLVQPRCEALLLAVPIGYAPVANVARNCAMCWMCGRHIDADYYVHVDVEGRVQSRPSKSCLPCAYVYRCLTVPVGTPES